MSLKEELENLSTIASATSDMITTLLNNVDKNEIDKVLKNAARSGKRSVLIIVDRYRIYSNNEVGSNFSIRYADHIDKAIPTDIDAVFSTVVNWFSETYVKGEGLSIKCDTTSDIKTIVLSW